MYTRDRLANFGDSVSSRHRVGNSRTLCALPTDSVPRAVSKLHVPDASAIAESRCYALKFICHTTAAIRFNGPYQDTVAAECISVNTTF